MSLSVWLWWAACGDDAKPADADTKDASPAEHSSVSAKEIDSVVANVVDDYDQLLRENCPCYVEMGAYPSVDECVMWQSSRESWMPCLHSALASYRTPETLEVFRCMQRVIKATAECLSDKACDPVARADCGPSPVECVAGHTELGLEIAKQCPDVSLLPRLN